MIGSGILLFITLPLYLYERHRYLQKKRDILKTFEKKNEMVKNKKKKTEQQPDYPSFRSQKSGLTWSGGNVHGARAKRGSKKGFIKH